MPSVEPNEKESHYVSRCVGDSDMVKEFPDQKRRVAVCYSLFKQHHQKHGKAAEAADWDETKAEIDRTHVVVTEEEARVVVPDFFEDTFETATKRLTGTFTIATMACRKTARNAFL